jgi:Zn-dependent protease
MKKPAVVSPSDEVTQIGTIFDTPIIVKGKTWLPAAGLIIWVFTTWLAGRRRPERRLYQRAGVGLLTMPIILGLEWCHNFAHAAAAHLIGKPMDAMRILWGMPMVVYYDINDTSVAPRQHIFRALGGPVFNASLLPFAFLLRNRTDPNSIARDLTDTAVGMDAFLSIVSLLPIPGIDGGPILKWSLVEYGATPDEADARVRKVNSLMSVFLGISSAVAIRKKQGFIAGLLALFAGLALAIGTGLLREQ